MPLPPTLVWWFFPQVPQKGTLGSLLAPCRASLALWWFWAVRFGKEFVSVGGWRSRRDQAYFSDSSNIYWPLEFVWHIAVQRWCVVLLPFCCSVPPCQNKELGSKVLSFRCVWLLAGKKKKMDIIEGRNWEVWAKFWRTKAMLSGWGCDGGCSWDLCDTRQNSALHRGLSWIGLYHTYLEWINKTWFYSSVSNLATVCPFIKKRDKRLSLQPWSSWKKYAFLNSFNKSGNFSLGNKFL